MREITLLLKYVKLALSEKIKPFNTSLINVSSRKEIALRHLSQVIKRIRIAILFLSAHHIDEASKEAQKSWRYLLSTLLLINLYEEGSAVNYYTVPRSKIFTFSKSLEDRGYKDLVKLSAIYFVLIQDIPRSEKKILTEVLIREELNYIKEWFSNIWSDDFEKELNEAFNEFTKLEKQSNKS
ncbi:hypothetical protein [Saccharolobus sp. A20]|uniref:hypothetical protein n=1 Tax=Saccharolobus sp. A20 TaxID=1891280 RepID=UPI001E47EF64|nr:hypothetical protein [Sulfolobus sp. A20]